jgi:hypothetical protein
MENDLRDEVPYADRPLTLHTDGTPLHQIATDTDRENEVAAKLGRIWDCELRRFAKLSPVDFYAVRDERMTAVIELKCRSHPAARFDTVFLNVRKWMVLSLASTGLMVPALFVVQFTDELRWIQWGEINASRQAIAGCGGKVKSRGDIEPIILVPVDQMSILEEKQDE